MAIGLIPPGLDIGTGHPNVEAFANASSADLRARWTLSDGRAFIENWAAQGYDRSYLENNVGRFFGKFDLRGIILSGKNLSRTDLSGSDLYAALLNHTLLIQSNLDSTYFSEADIRGANLSWSSARDAFFDNVVFDQKTTLLGVPLQSVNFNLAALLYDQARTEQRIAHLQKRSPIFAAFLRITSDYGRSFLRWSFWTISLILIYATIFYETRSGFSGLATFFDAVYFSTVTFTTLGFGDITPTTPFTRFCTLLDVVTGFVMGGLLVAILAKRLLGD